MSYGGVYKRLTASLTEGYRGPDMAGLKDGYRGFCMASRMKGCRGVYIDILMEWYSSVCILFYEWV
jgi:hypothetical protein